MHYLIRSEAVSPEGVAVLFASEALLPEQIACSNAPFGIRVQFWRPEAAILEGMAIRMYSGIRMRVLDAFARTLCVPCIALRRRCGWVGNERSARGGPRQAGAGRPEPGSSLA